MSLTAKRFSVPDGACVLDSILCNPHQLWLKSPLNGGDLYSNNNFTVFFQIEPLIPHPIYNGGDELW